MELHDPNEDKLVEVIGMERTKLFID
jgi:hypothetical protein